MKTGKRLHGPPKRGCLRVMVCRVRKRIADEKELQPHHLRRIDDMLKRYAKTMLPAVYNRLKALREEACWYVKVFKMAKKTVKLDQPADSLSTVHRAAMFHDTVELLRKGTDVPGYTLIKSDKALNNKTVEVVINLGDGWSLCRYVPA